MRYHIFTSAFVSGGQLFAVKIYVDQFNSLKTRCDSIERWVYFFVPDSAHGQDELPLLIAYHGSNEDGQTFRSRTTGCGYDEAAVREMVIVAYPDGYKRHWNE